MCEESHKLKKVSRAPQVTGERSADIIIRQISVGKKVSHFPQQTLPYKVCMKLGPIEGGRVEEIWLFDNNLDMIRGKDRERVNPRMLRKCNMYETMK